MKNFNNLPADMTGYIVPESEYLVFSTSTSDAGSFIENLKQAWKYIALTGLPDSGYKHAGTHELTIYRPEINPFSKDIYIPVIKAAIKEVQDGESKFKIHNSVADSLERAINLVGGVEEFIRHDDT